MASEFGNQVARKFVARASLMPVGKPTARADVVNRVGAADASYCGGDPVNGEDWVLLSVQGPNGDDMEIRIPRRTALELAATIADRAGSP